MFQKKKTDIFSNNNIKFDTPTYNHPQNNKFEFEPIKKNSYEYIRKLVTEKDDVEMPVASVKSAIKFKINKK